jgi:antitoxin component YwqK of YwqJK toxin-antitoxin module
LKQGLWRTYYKSGNPQTEFNYRDDKKHGTFRWFSDEGIVTKMEIWKNGELALDEAVNMKLDIKRDYYNNGRPKSSVNLINGVKEGVYREYDNLGKITGSKLYDKDKIIAEGGIVDARGLQQGKWKYFYADGKIRMEGEFKDGMRDGLWKFFYPNQQLQQTGNYSKNQPDGEWNWYHTNNQLLRREFYKNGKEEGESVEYSETGAEITKGNYVNGLREGEWIFKNGEYIAQGNYVEGNKDGLWKETFLNGKPAFTGEYFEGQENGKHVYYYDTGQIKEEQNYRLGLKDGEWKSYDINGELLLSTTWRNGNVVKMEGVKVN